MAASGQPAASDVLLRIFAQNYYPSQTRTGEAFVARYDTPSVMIRMTGRDSLGSRLMLDYFRATNKVPNKEAVTGTVGIAEAIARGKRPATPALRIAPHGGALYLDLGRRDGSAVELRPGGWRVVERPPVLFARTALSAELPWPIEGGGSLDGCRHLFNISGPSEWALFTACRVASLIPGITHPIELVTGPAGSAKTTTTKLMSNWVDPAPVMIPVPRDGRTWAAMAASRYVLPVDNVSVIPPWWSDLLCKAASGDGWLDRALYTDMDVAVAAFQSVVILNGIGLGTIRGDLADRVVWHKLEKPPWYSSDDELEDRWNGAWPAALAWLCDRACELMADMSWQPAPQAESRLARFEQIVDAIDERWGTRAGQAWAAGRHEVLEDVAEGDEIAVAIREAVKAPWHGSSGELVELLELYGGLRAPNRGAGSWTPRMVSERVDRSRSALEALGWQIWRHREPGSGRRLWYMAPPSSSNGVPESLKDLDRRFPEA
jgi:hypothetical protein